MPWYSVSKNRCASRVNGCYFHGPSCVCFWIFAFTFCFVGPRSSPNLLPETMPISFVTHVRNTPHTRDCQVLHGAAPGRMAAEESPEPRDIYWNNTRVTRKERNRRRIFVEGFLLLLYVFYVIPVTLLYLLLSEESIVSYAGWIQDWYNSVSVTNTRNRVFFVRGENSPSGQRFVSPGTVAVAVASIEAFDPLLGLFVKGLGVVHFL